MSMTLLVVNVEDEYIETIEQLERHIQTMLPSTSLVDVWIDDVSTIDAIAEDMTEFVYDQRDFPGGGFVIMLTLADYVDDIRAGVIDVFRDSGATVIFGLSEEQRQSPEFINVWKQYRLDEYDPWSHITSFARWRIQPR